MRTGQERKTRQKRGMFDVKRWENIRNKDNDQRNKESVWKIGLFFLLFFVCLFDSPLLSASFAISLVEEIDSKLGLAEEFGEFGD